MHDCLRSRDGQAMVSLFGMTAYGEGLSLWQPDITTYSRLASFSAFDMLRYAKLRTADFIKVIPELASIDPHILSRIDVDGATCDA
jgi:hypothetical protein